MTRQDIENSKKMSLEETTNKNNRPIKRRKKKISHKKMLIIILLIIISAITLSKASPAVVETIGTVIEKVETTFETITKPNNFNELLEKKDGKDDEQLLEETKYLIEKELTESALNLVNSSTKRSQNNQNYYYEFNFDKVNIDDYLTVGKMIDSERKNQIFEYENAIFVEDAWKNLTPETQAIIFGRTVLPFLKGNGDIVFKAQFESVTGINLDSLTSDELQKEYEKGMSNLAETVLINKGIISNTTKRTGTGRGGK